MLSKFRSSWRFPVVNLVGLGLLFALYLDGILSKPFLGPNAPFCYAIAAFTAFGVAMAGIGNYGWASWVARYTIRIGLIGTIVGLIIAFSVASAGGDKGQLIQGVVSGMYISLYATLLGIVGNFWIKINLLICYNLTEE